MVSLVLTLSNRCDDKSGEISALLINKFWQMCDNILEKENSDSVGRSVSVCVCMCECERER